MEEVRRIPDEAIDLLVSAARLDMAGHELIAHGMRLVARASLHEQGFTPLRVNQLISDTNVLAREEGEFASL